PPVKPLGCWPAWPTAPMSLPAILGWASSPRCAGTCRWRSGWPAGQLAHHPAWTPAGLAGDLAAARDRLALMAAENPSGVAAFGLSYADLDDGQQRLFRRLGLHPGLDVDAYAAAALDDTTVGQARRGLGALYDQHLITEPAPGRYRFHDLIREHARALAAADDPTAQDLAAAPL